MTTADGNRDLISQVQALVDPILAEAGMELVELAAHPSSGQVLIRLLVDRPGGVTLSACATINHRVSNALEQTNVIEGRYTVEVSSPGLDRPLTTRRDFERAIGEDVRLELAENGRSKELTGSVLAVQPDAVVINTPSGNVTVPMTQIRLAKKAVRW